MQDVILFPAQQEETEETELTDAVAVAVVLVEEDRKMVPMTGEVPVAVAVAVEWEAQAEQVEQVAEEVSQFFFATTEREELYKIVF